ncbi:MAG TPA: MFS transporter [Candidatus Limnocylindrales bacterium]
MSLIQAYRGLLRNRRLARLLVGEFISSIGDWLYLVALLIVVYRDSTDPVLLGIVGAARVLPYVLLSVPAGFVADRFDRRLVLMVTDVARGAIMLGLAWLVANDGPLVAIVGLSIAATCFSAFFGPTIGSFLPTLVRDEAELGPANSAWSSLDNLAFVIGPAVAGLLIELSDLTVAFMLNAVSFGLVTLVLWRLPSGGRTGQLAAEVPLPADVAGGLPGHSIDSGAGEPGSAVPDAAVGTEPSLASLVRPLLGLATIDIVAGFVFGGLGILTVVLASAAYGAGDEATGYLNAAVGVGGVVGAITSGWLVLRLHLGPPLVAGALAFGIGVAVLGQVNVLAVALVAIAVAAAGDLVVEVVSTTIFQRVVPQSMRGRALGVLETLGTLSYAGGSLAVPLLADGLGVGPVLLASGAALAVSAVVALALVGTHATRTESEASVILRRVARLPILAGLPPARIESAARALRRISVAAGTTVIEQGEPADRFYIIADGTFAVTQQERGEPAAKPRLLRHMGPDEVFGEIGLLTGAPRSATVTAEKDGVLLALDGPDFLELVSAGPGLANRLLELHRGATGARPTTKATAALSDA